MHRSTQKAFHNIFVGIPQYQQGYLVYLPSIMKIISAYDAVFVENISSSLADT